MVSSASLGASGSTVMTIMMKLMSLMTMMMMMFLLKPTTHAMNVLIGEDKTSTEQ